MTIISDLSTATPDTAADSLVFLDASDTTNSAQGTVKRALADNFGWLPLAGGTMTGDITLPGDPDAALKAATKQYVDAQAGATNLDDLNDVSVPTPTDAQVLTWVDANSQWEAADAGGGGASDVDDLTTDTGSAAEMLRVASGGGSLEYRTPAQVLADIGAVDKTGDTMTGALEIGGDDAGVDFTALKLRTLLSPARGWDIISGQFSHPDYGNYPLIFSPVNGQRVVIPTLRLTNASTAIEYDTALVARNTDGTSVFNFGSGTYFGERGLGVFFRAGDAATGDTVMRIDRGNKRLAIAEDDSLTPGSKLHVVDADAVTAAVTDITTLGHNSSGTPAAGFGAGLLYQLESSTTEDRNAARIAALWNVATDASREADLVLSAYEQATEREGLRIRGSGGGAQIGFLGAAPAGQQTGGAQTAGGSYGATEQDMLQKAYDALRTFGLLA